MVALLVVVLVVVVGAVLYMRSRSSGEAPPQEEAEDVAEDTDVDKMGVTYESAGILEYETEGAATRSEGTTGSIEEPIYSLEEAEEYKPE
jgi:flagellar basal body-associated protein FliL